MPSDFWNWWQILNPFKGYAPWNNEILIREVGPILIGMLALYHCYKTFGGWKTALFFFGSFLFTGLEENFWILYGHFTGQETYFFSPYEYYLWFGTVPLTVCVGWFFIAYGMVYIGSKLFGRAIGEAGLFKSALVGGLLAVNLDLVIDPIAVRNVWWVWPQATEETFWILGIPLTNFVGWFLLIFLFAILWEKIPPKEAEWGRKKTTLGFFGYLGILLGLTLVILILVQILTYVLGLNGINLLDSIFPIVRP
ncbi:MAG: carotenoid biosynthesis protein [Candidatus Helarchaeota archaeon]